MVVGLASSEGLIGPIRPFEPRRDLKALADLIEIGFGPELVATGSHMVQDLREMAQWGAALRVAGSLPGFLSGYVWVEDGETVANVTITPEKHGDGWTLSNIVVAPPWRGRGIAGALVDTALGHIQRQGGRRALLQVRSDNLIAHALYEHRGFRRFDTIYETQLSHRDWPMVVGKRPELIRGLRFWEGPALYRLVVESMPPLVARFKPPPSSRYRRGPIAQVSQAFQAVMGGEDLIERVAVDGKMLCGYVGLAAHLWRGPHELELWVQPAQKGRWEEALLNELFRAISHLPRHNIRTSVSAIDAKTLEVLARFGFATLRVLDQMVLEFDPV